MNYTKPTYFQGLKHGIPTALGYFVVSFTFGMMASIGGMSPFQATLISATSLTSAGQFAGINIMFAAGSYLELVLSMLIINSRYALMAAAMSQKIQTGTPLYKKMLMSIFITDENFAVAMVEVEHITFQYYIGVATLPYIGWVSGTLLGSIMDNLMSPALQNASSIALYCMFIALFMPPAREQKSIRNVVLFVIALSLILYYVPLFTFITVGYRVLIAAILGALYGALKYPQEVV